jgi:uncharacterized OB-fold protein
MYEITCESCGRVGFHPSRVAAESRAETHANDTGHECSVTTMDD